MQDAKYKHTDRDYTSDKKSVWPDRKTYENNTFDVGQFHINLDTLLGSRCGKTHGNGLESFLSRGIKQLQLNFLAIKLDRSKLEINTNSWCTVHVCMEKCHTPESEKAVT